MSEEKKKDEVADALAALAAGEHTEEPPLSGSGMTEQVHLDQDRPAGPAPSQAAHPNLPPAEAPTAPPPSSAPPKSVPTKQKPVARPVPLRPAAPQVRAAPPPASRRPTAPPPLSTPLDAPPDGPRRSGGGRGSVRAASPTPPGRPVTPTGRAAPPAPFLPPPPDYVPPAPADDFVVHDDTVSPEEQAHEAEVLAEADAVAHVVDDGDLVNLPAPTPEMLLHRHVPARPKQEMVSRTLGFKQTLIPILLTMGVGLLGIATDVLAQGEESPLLGHAWIPLTLIVLGAVMLVFAAITMLQVRNQLAQQAPS